MLGKTCPRIITNYHEFEKSTDARKRKEIYNKRDIITKPEKGRG